MSTVVPIFQIRTDSTPAPPPPSREEVKQQEINASQTLQQAAAGCVLLYLCEFKRFRSGVNL